MGLPAQPEPLAHLATKAFQAHQAPTETMDLMACQGSRVRPGRLELRVLPARLGLRVNPGKMAQTANLALRESPELPGPLVPLERKAQSGRLHSLRPKRGQKARRGILVLLGKPERKAQSAPPRSWRRNRAKRGRKAIPALSALLDFRAQSARPCL